jgi:hypothetical protein
VPDRRPEQQDENGVVEVHMWDREEQELSHIKVMLDELERLIHGSGVEQTTSVMTPAYWRMRIQEVLAVLDLPRLTMEQASALLIRLDSLSAGWDKHCDPARRAKRN